MNKQETVRRLGFLREALVNATKVNATLSMENWVDNEYEPEEVPETVEDAHNCGTVCCVAGWGGYHPELRKLGLISGENSLWCTGEWDIFDNLGGFFGISELERDVLFGCEKLHTTHSRQHLACTTKVPLHAAEEKLDFSNMTLEDAIFLVDAVIANYIGD